MNDNWQRYKGWKITIQKNGLWMAVRINPTKYFAATSLTAALKSIDRRERELSRSKSKSKR